MSEYNHALIPLPGLDGTDVLFRPLLDRLTVPASPITYPQTSPSTYSTILPHILQSLPLDQDYILLGWSFSGPLAVMAAATRPAGLKGVILAASFIRNPLPYLPSWARYVVRPLLFSHFSRFSRIKALLGGYSTPELARLLEEAHSRVPPEVMADRIRQVLSVNAESELRECPVPVLYLGAQNDRVVPRRNLRRIQQIRRDVQSVMIQGPHLALTTHPKEAASAIERFMDSLTGCNVNKE